MDSRFQRIATYIVLIIILAGIGFLVYRFIQTPRTDDVKTLVINRDGHFNTAELQLENNEVLRIRNEDEQDHIVVREDNDQTLIEVEADSTSREIELPVNSRISLHLAFDENQKATLLIGDAPVAEEEEEKPEAPKPTDEPKEETPTASENGNLPNTGPEGLYLFPLFAAAGMGLIKLSNRVLKK